MKKVKTLEPIDKQIIALKKKGVTTREISSQLNISIPLVKWKLLQMRRYYNCDNTLSLILKIDAIEAQEKKL